MGFLNWRSSTLKQEIGTHQLGSCLTLRIAQAEAAELARSFEALMSAPPSEELRVNLPNEWLVFWKLRPVGGSRLLLAHPAQAEWVVTAALDAAHAGVFVECLKKLGPGERLAVSETGSVGYPSNVEIVIEIAS